MAANADTVNVVITFAKDRSRQGKTEALPVAEARQLVHEGGARYATEAQERKATPGK